MHVLLYFSFRIIFIKNIIILYTIIKEYLYYLNLIILIIDIIYLILALIIFFIIILKFFIFLLGLDITNKDVFLISINFQPFINQYMNLVQFKLLFYHQFLIHLLNLRNLYLLVKVNTGYVHFINLHRLIFIYLFILLFQLITNSQFILIFNCL